MQGEGEGGGRREEGGGRMRVQGEGEGGGRREVVEGGGRERGGRGVRKVCKVVAVEEIV